MLTVLKLVFEYLGPYNHPRDFPLGQGGITYCLCVCQSGSELIDDAAEAEYRQFFHNPGQLWFLSHKGAAISEISDIVNNNHRTIQAPTEAMVTSSTRKMD